MSKTRFIYSSLVASLAVAIAAAPAVAQTGEAESISKTNEGLSVIVVTARKRDENIQDVSASISALSSDDLARRFDSDVRDFANSAPNVVIDDTQQGPGGVAAVTIRGIGVADVEKSIDPAVGVVLDEIYLGTSSGNLVRAIDIDRVEVLRGPQGTLFGRNAIGGVINLGRSRPTQELTGRARAFYGSYDSLNLEGIVSFGLTDWASVKFTGAYRRSDGYIFNTLQNQPGQRSEFSALGVQLLIEPTPGLEILLSFDDQNTDQDPPQLNNLAAPTDLFCATFGQCGRGNGVPQSGDRYISLSDGRLEKNASFDMNLGIAKVKWEATDNLSFDYIYGRMETDEEIRQDFDATPLTLFHTDRPVVYQQDTHELRLTYETDRFNLVAGGYYWDSEYTINLVSLIGFIVPNTVLQIPQTVNQTTKSYAGFFEADWEIVDGLTVTAGGRYTRDKKTSGILDAGIGLNSLTNPEEESWSQFTPRAAISYDVADNFMVYGLYSRGYRSGGFVGRPSSLTTATIPYDPETVDNFEIGLKSELFDNRVRFNASAFLMKYDDKQEDIDVPVPGMGTGRESRTVNAATAEVKGVEIDVAGKLSDHFSFNANVGYLDAQYESFIADTNNDGIPDDNSNLRLRRAPNWTWTLGGTFEYPVGPGDLWINGSVRYIGPHEITFLNNPELANDGQYLADMSINYKINNTQVSAYVKNLFEEDGYTIGFDVLGLWSYGAPRPPRVFGVAVTQDF